MRGCSPRRYVWNKMDIGQSQGNDKLVGLKKFSGQVSLTNLPPHRGLIISIAFFKVDGLHSDVPFGGNPSGEEISDVTEIYNNVNLELDMTDTSMAAPFSLNREKGYFYIQARVILFRKKDEKMYAQAEQYFYSQRPILLNDDLSSVVLPVKWPAIPIEELGLYEKIKPKVR